MHIATKDAEESLDPSGNLSSLIKRYVKYLKLRMAKKSRKRSGVENSGEKRGAAWRGGKDKTGQEHTGGDRRGQERGTY